MVDKTVTVPTIEYLIYQRTDRSVFYGKPFEKSEDCGERVIGTSFHKIDAEYICKAISSYERSHSLHVSMRGNDADGYSWEVEWSSGSKLSGHSQEFETASKDVHTALIAGYGYVG